VVADAGPLMGLARVGRLALLRHLYRHIVIPAAVHTELDVDSRRPGARMLEAAISAAWVTIESPSTVDEVASLARILGPGECEAIVLAGELDARFLLIDDQRGRQIARRRAVPVVGLAGVLLAAKSHGEIVTVRPVLEELSQAGYRLAPRLVTAVLARANE